MHLVLLEELKYFFAINPATVPVGLILSNKIKVFKMYAQYMLDLSKSRNTLRENLENKQFAQFIEECKKNDLSGLSIDLASLLTIPLNKISQYQRDIEDIKSNTQENDIDYLPLKNMIIEMQNLKEYVTISKTFTDISEIE